MEAMIPAVVTVMWSAPNLSTVAQTAGRDGRVIGAVGLDPDRLSLIT